MKIQPIAERSSRQRMPYALQAIARAALAALFILLCVLTSHATTKPNTKHVLVLYSFFERDPTSLRDTEASLRAHLPWPVDFSVVYLENPRFEEDSYRDSLAENFRRTYEDNKPDLVLVASEPALEFAEQYRERMFPGVPIVFWAVSSSLADQKIPGVTGVATPAGIRDTINLALRLQPDTTSIAVITGTTRIERSWLADIQSQLLAYRNRVKEVDIVGPPGPDLLEKIAALPPHTVVLFQLFPRDSDQPAISNWDVLARTSRQFPTYSLFPTLALDRGGIGGAYYDGAKDSVLAGELGARALLRQNSGDIPVEHIPNLQISVDSRQLRRWHIPESALPPGSLVLYRQPGVWDQYKGYILGCISLIILQGALISALLWQRRRRRRIEAELALTHDSLRLAVEAGRSVGWDTDFRSGRNRWFGDLQTIFGMPDEAHDGRTGDFRTYIHPDDRSTFDSVIEDARQHRKQYAAEFRVIRTNGDIRWIAAKGRFYHTADGEPERMLGMATDITERKMAEEALNELSGQLIRAQEEERSRIAREIHDDYQQRLALIAMGLDDLAQDADKGTDLQSSRLYELWNMVSELGADLHSLSHRLHSSTLDSLGLAAGLRGLCTEFGSRHAIQVDVFTDRLPRNIPQDVALCLFRIAQEALQNIRKHSRAEKAAVRLEVQGETIHLSVSDEGRGFDLVNASKQYGIGIRSMEERLRLVRGRLTIRSRPKNGTTVDAWAPI
jgi:PAS domain S-box-containing protein